MTTPAILAYVPGATVTGMDDTGIIPDWGHNRLYSINTGNTPGSSGFSQITAYSSGDVSLQRKLGDLPADVTYVQAFSGAAWCLTYGGELVFISSSSSNSVTLAALQAFNLKFLSSFGVESSDTSASADNRILCPYSIVPLRAGFVDWIIACAASSTFNPGEVCALSMPGMVLSNLGNTVQARAIPGRGFTGTTAGSVFVVGRVADGDFPSTAAFGLHVVSLDPPIGTPVLTHVANITPALIDATWTHFTGISAPAYDQTDGNPIIMVKTADAVTNTVYFVKLDAASGVVLWTCPVNHYDTYADADMPRHSIVNQKLYYLGSSLTLYTINTSTGVATTEIVSNLGPASAQISEDANNSLVVNVNWADGGTTPTYLGTYMGTEGNHILSPQWARWLPFGGIVPPPQPPPPDPPINGAASVSINRAFSYVLDGHTFYVLDLGAQGTFAYDQVTGQWSNFSTGTIATDSGANPQWNFVNGCMWGQRIVAGDLTTADVWEMVPSAVLDNDALQIQHACTGGIATRSRTYHSVDALRVTASFGLIDDSSPTTFRLRFSDDQENTWSPYYDVTLTSGAYGTELAWRSLGSFAAPGRVFELTDVGGLIRIDGCDAFIDGFDNDQEPATEADNG